MENNTSLQQQLLEAGVHFGHLKKKWNPKMLPYIFAEKKGIHIIDLNKTVEHLQETAAALKQIAKSGKKIMFVATKKQAKEIVSECAKKVNMPYATERWLGGMLTNFKTVKQSIKRLHDYETMLQDGSLDKFGKKEALGYKREVEKLERSIGGIKEMGGLPDAIFIIDVGHESGAVTEAAKLGIPVIGVVDTNNSPDGITYVIPGNDDSSRAIRLYARGIADAVLEGRSQSIAEIVKSASEEVAAAE